MQKDTDEYIRERLQKLTGSGLHEAEAILLLAEKLGDVEKALGPIQLALCYTLKILLAVMDKEELALRVTDKRREH